jgi:hypothetical protein
VREIAPRTERVRGTRDRFRAKSQSGAEDAAATFPPPKKRRGATRLS